MTGATLNVEDAYANHLLRPLFDREVDQRNEYQTRSLLAVPLCTPAGNVIGVMELINAQRSPNVVVPFAPESRARWRGLRLAGGGGRAPLDPRRGHLQGHAD